MSVNWQDIKYGDLVSVVDIFDRTKRGRVVGVFPRTDSILIDDGAGDMHLMTRGSVKSCIFHSPKYFCASRKPKEGRELMLVQREGEVILTQDGEPILKFVDGQEGFVVLGGAK